METGVVVDLLREAIMVSLEISGPVLGVAVLVGLMIGLLQAVTQIQDQTVAFVPKMLAILVALSFTIPWLLSKLVTYVSELYTSIPQRL